MKALLSKFTRNKQNQPQSQQHDVADGPKISELEKSSPSIPVLPPLPQWPPQVPPSPTPPSTQDLKPLPQPRVRSPDQTDTAGRNARKGGANSMATTSTSSTVAPDKKVAFISPPPTPADMRNGAAVSTRTANASRPSQNSEAGKVEPSGSRTNLAGTASRASGAKVSIATRSVTSPSYGQRTFSNDVSSIRSSTPYSQSANSSRILAAPSWSEAAEEDLVSNLGPRERTRQEVLWEIVASEERYVAELVKMKETFIDPLLHPFSTSPISSPTLPATTTVEDLFYRHVSPTESLDNLPIAARFLSPTILDTIPASSPTPQIDGDSSGDEDGDVLGRGYASSASGHGHSNNKTTHPRSPYRSNARRSAGTTPVPFPSRSHQSLPPPPRGDDHALSTASLGRQNIFTFVDGRQPEESRRSTATPASRVFRKLRKSSPALPNPSETAIEGAVPPHLLPEELRRCLEVIEAGILNGHKMLADGLRKRYEEQYPLVRSLADVFVSNSHILREYATYVLHLERALEQVDNALSTANDPKLRPKKSSEQEWHKICKLLQRLEELAAEKAETGLAISLSKPFQRLLKYPLLFQNLLFHTDPSTYEYESTLQMVGEVETIVRSIEDEKIQKEERDRTRDAFARIEGIDKVKALAVPKPSRVLEQEKCLNGDGLMSAPSSPSRLATSGYSKAAAKGKTSLKRFSDAFQPGNGSNGIGKKKDLWLVVFNDVVLRCQRTGVTTLPLATTTNSRTNSMPELQGKTKYATTGRRGVQVKPRNLYKFIAIENWAIGEVQRPESGVVSMQDREREQRALDPLHDADETGDGIESDDSDRKSKMSFSYWGADKVTIQKPAVNGRKAAVRGRRGSPLSTAAYGRESSANAKFGTRLVSDDSPAKAAARPSSRRHGATPLARRPSAPSEESAISRATTTARPPWDGSTRATPVASPVSRRTRANSQDTVTQQVTPPHKVASIAPSEDSGVGMYRQMLAQNPSFEHDSN